MIFASDIIAFIAVVIMAIAFFSLCDVPEDAPAAGCIVILVVLGIILLLGMLTEVF